MRLKVLLVFLVVAALALITSAVNGKPTKEISPGTSKVRTLDLNEFNTLAILDEVGRENSEKIANSISELNTTGDNSPIYLLLDSPGGSVVSGAKVINAIEASRRPVHTVCLTLCASMAAIIHSYGHKRLAMNRAVLMYHDASGEFSGEFTRIKSLFGMIDRYVEKMDENVVKRSQLSKETFEGLKVKEIWIDTDDALSKGLVDELVFVNTNSLVPAIPTDLKRQSVTHPHTKFDVRM